MFELNFRDERYCRSRAPVAISDWKIELTPGCRLRQFDYATISDVIIHALATRPVKMPGYLRGARLLI